MAGQTTETHHLIDFASRHERTSLKSFNAGSALWRAENLLDDIDALITLSEESEKKEVRFGSIVSSYEIISYYAVGLVTCLEWHARSRFVDLTLYRPGVIQTADIKSIAGAAISQMVASGVAVPHLLGAATLVNSIRQYVAIFQRLFDELGIHRQLERELRHVEVMGEAGKHSLYEDLEILYARRHELVHEISYGMIGHHNLRDVWTLSEAKSYAINAIACIKLVEGLVTEHGPKDFPNRLTKDYTPEDEIDKLQEAITDVEEQITAAIAHDEDGLEKWKIALQAQKETLEKEMEFIDTAEALRPLRYLDVGYQMKSQLLKARLTFLLALRVETDY
jgi:hypothetical protein